MHVQSCRGVVINAPEFFADPAFQHWLEDAPAKFTWHRDGAMDEWSDVVVLVDPSLNGEGSDSDMPSHIWDRIVDACGDYLRADCCAANHYMVRLTNLVT